MENTSAHAVPGLEEEYAARVDNGLAHGIAKLDLTGWSKYQTPNLKLQTQPYDILLSPGCGLGEAQLIVLAPAFAKMEGLKEIILSGTHARCSFEPNARFGPKDYKS